jgi:prephenate dehydrogenase
MTVNLTVIGLHQIGASIGMALEIHKMNIHRTGVDAEPTLAQNLLKKKALDHVAYNLHTAVKDANLVIMAVPADQVEETLRQIADDLQPGTVVIDTSPNRQQSIAWAREILPADRHFISMTPVINPAYLDVPRELAYEPHADLFSQGAMVITSAIDTPSEALKLASDLAHLLNSHAYFSEPIEADSVDTSVNLLPKLVAAALVNTTTAQPGWRDSERLAGMAYLKTTFAAELPDEEKELGKTAILNSEHTARLLNEMIANLQEISDAVESRDNEALQSLLEGAKLHREEWLSHRLKADWDAYPLPSTLSTKESIAGLFGGRPRRKK